MKKLLFVFLLFPMLSFSQTFDMGIGYGSGKIGTIDFGYIDKTNVCYDVEIGRQMPIGARGELYNNINWDEMPEDHQSEGEFFELVLNGAIGYKYKSVMFAGILGYANNSRYRNAYDSFHILGNNGEYYKTTSASGDKANVGVKFKYFIDLEGATPWWLSLGVKATNVEGVGLSLGLSF